MLCGRLFRPLKLRLSSLLMAGFLMFSNGLAYADNAPSESKIKAAFLFKFTSYVEWPPGSFDAQDSPLIISVVDADDVAAELSRLVVGRAVNGHAIVVRRLGANDAATNSHVLFVASTASNRFGRIVASARSSAVLTVTELDDTPTFSSVINFVVIDDQVRFDVSLPAAERGNLKISSRLLTVAHQVISVTP
ncbi:MAG: hypothetical protein JWL63_1621 [Rhodocyclales bacterium]|nr:hypothetical protein [Rhodocyclales bacterium]